MVCNPQTGPLSTRHFHWGEGDELTLSSLPSSRPAYTLQSWRFCLPCCSEECLRVEKGKKGLRY